MMDVGYTPDEWVQIISKRLTKESARNFEQQLIKKYNPRFNKRMGSLPKLSNDDRAWAQFLYGNGVSYKKIGEALNVSTMTVWRSLH
jgi:DNA-directed RNA polymerase specialized sigma subunit